MQVHWFINIRALWKRPDTVCPPLAEVIHDIRSGCDGAPGLITTDTRLVSRMVFCSDDIEGCLTKRNGDLASDVLMMKMLYGISFSSNHMIIF